MPTTERHPRPHVRARPRPGMSCPARGQQRVRARTRSRGRDAIRSRGRQCADQRRRRHRSGRSGVAAWPTPRPRPRGRHRARFEMLAWRHRMACPGMDLCPRGRIGLSAVRGVDRLTRGLDRIGGQLVAQTLEALGTEVAFGVPGVHALAIWEGLRSTEIRAIGTRTELCAGFAADGYARSSGRPGVVLLSTGPGALNSLTAVMEAASSHVPLVLISSQIPIGLVGRGRGYLHELPDQLGAFQTLVKGAWRATSVESIPGILQRAFELALTPPSGPVFVEIPVDLLTGRRQPGVADRRHRALDSAPGRAAVASAGGGGSARAGPVAGDLGRRRRDPLARAPCRPGAGGAARRAGGDDLHGQGRDRRLASARRRLRLRRGGVRRANDRSRRRVVRRHRAGGRDDRPVRALVRRGGDPSGRRARANRGDV